MSDAPLQAEGFTLVEIMAVLILMALVSSLAVVSLHAATQQANWEQTCDRLSRFDRGTRDQAVELNRNMQIRFDLQTMSISRWLNDAIPTQRSTWSLPDHQRIVTVLLEGAAPQGREMYVPISSAGLSPTYALCLESQEQTKWLLFAGLSGQMRQCASDSQVQELFHALARTDTD